MSISVLLERTDDLLEKLYQRVPDPNPTLLFESTELQEYTEQSPIWLESASSAFIIEQMREIPSAWPGLIIESQASNENLLAHLRYILFIRFDTERKGVLRYSNPRTASYFFTVKDETTSGTWMGPINRMNWYGGTWFDLANNSLRWFSVENGNTRDWKENDGLNSLHLDVLHEQALQRQQKEHFVYLWWHKQSNASLADAAQFLDEGIADGFLEPQELNEYLSLRASYPNTQTPMVPKCGGGEERLELLRQYLSSNFENKESLT
ncbi:MULTISPECIES: DUF4123 domain-containing protein [unclassified Pseudomonas]|uniref:DUF4123 domain-containing protein n=1 Tax=unclassified Pseudomonas TaxID=196821 RepID=UPI0030DA886A